MSKYEYRNLLKVMSSKQEPAMKIKVGDEVKYIGPVLHWKRGTHTVTKVKLGGLVILGRGKVVSIKNLNLLHRPEPTVSEVLQPTEYNLRTAWEQNTYVPWPIRKARAEEEALTKLISEVKKGKES